MYFVRIILGKSSVDVKTEADSNDITEHLHDNQQSIGMFGFFDDLFFAVIFLYLFFVFIWWWLYVFDVTCNTLWCRKVMFKLLEFDNEDQS